MNTDFIPNPIDVRKAYTHLKAANHSLKFVMEMPAKRIHYLQNVAFHQSEAEKFLDGTYRYNPPVVN